MPASCALDVVGFTIATMSGAGPAMGDKGTTSARMRDTRTLRICTLNVHGWHNEERGAFEGLVRMLAAARPDVIALQEATKRRVPELATALGNLHWTVRHNCAILSSLPLRGFEEGQSSGRGNEAGRRGMGGKGSTDGKGFKGDKGGKVRNSVATITPRDGLDVQICCLHLDHVREPTRLVQLDAVATRQLFGASKPAAQVWLGDLNALTRSDYDDDAWAAIAEHRSDANWEAPQSDVSDVMTGGATSGGGVGGGARRRKRRGANAGSVGKRLGGGVRTSLAFTDCWTAAGERAGPLGTSRFATRIDYVYVSPSVAAVAEVKSCEHLKTIPHVSDHNAVLATLEWRASVEASAEA